jgi:hypothetical protein
MSYIVAFVRLSLRGEAYRFNCFRDDVGAEDEVLVRLGNGTYRPGTVEKIQYLDWKCDGAVVCKMTEAVKKGSGFIPGQGVSPFRGLTNNRAMIQHLRSRGWVSLGHGANFKALCGYYNGRDTAHIWFTNRSIRLEILDCAEPVPPEGTFAAATPRSNRQVMHRFSRTTFNLYEGIARFAATFEANTCDYDRFFKPVGSRSRQPVDVERARGLVRQERDEMADLYKAMGGDGGSLYLSDGLYLGPGGNWRDG